MPKPTQTQAQKHAHTHDTLLLDRIRVMSDSGSEGEGHDQGRRRMCPSRTSRHLMSLRSRDQSDLGGESTRDVDGLAADRHGSSGSRVGVATQAEQPRQMVRRSDTVDDGQSGYDPSDVDSDSTIEGDVEGEVDQQTASTLVGRRCAAEELHTSSLVGSRCAAEERQSASLVGNFIVTEEQRSSAAEAG